jgi:hypothetical protein
VWPGIVAIVAIVTSLTIGTESGPERSALHLRFIRAPAKSYAKTLRPLGAGPVGCFPLHLGTLHLFLVCTPWSYSHSGHPSTTVAATSSPIYSIRYWYGTFPCSQDPYHQQGSLNFGTGPQSNDNPLWQFELNRFITGIRDHKCHSSPKTILSLERQHAVEVQARYHPHKVTFTPWVYHKRPRKST